MNEYGRMAHDHWKRWLPQQYSQIKDPNSFFSMLGDQVANRIAELTLDLAGDDPPEETFLAKLGRLNNARQQAREIVLPETVLPEPEPETTEHGDPDREPDLTQTDWVPLREDPNHPWWRQAMAEETSRLA